MNSTATECLELVAAQLPMARAYARQEAAFFWVFVEAVGRQFIFEVTPREVGVSEINEDELPFTGHDEAT